MDLKEGDIIYTTCTGMPICYHVGIIIYDNGKPMVYNNSPKLKNIVGGNILAQHLDDFFKDRRLIQKISTNVDPDTVRQYSNDMAHHTWDPLFYNCEDYVNEVVYNNRKSELRQTWMFGGLMAWLIF